MSPPEDRPDLPPEQDAVRRLLAEARHDEPVPPAVAARLDAVLEELSAERRPAGRSPGHEPLPAADVVDLAARGRRARSAGLMAAAAVVVAGVGLGQLLGGTGNEDAGSTAGAGSDAGGSREFDSQDGGGAGVDSPGEESLAESKRNQAGAAAGGYTVSSSTLRRDLRAALRSSTMSTTAQDVPCAPADADLDGTWVPVLLDGRPGLAVYGSERADRRRVVVYVCGADLPEHTLSLAAP